MYLFRPVSLTIKPSLIIGFLSLMTGFSMLVGVLIQPPAFLPSRAIPLDIRDYRLTDVGTAPAPGTSDNSLPSSLAQITEWDSLLTASRQIPQSTDQKTDQKTDQRLDQATSIQRPSTAPARPSRNRQDIPKPGVVSKAVLSYALPKLTAANRSADFVGFEVPAIMTTSLPAGLDALPVPQKKELFVRLLLPLILSANDEIIQHQLRLEKSLSSGADRQSSYLANHYGMKEFDPDNAVDIAELRKRIQPIPVSLAMAQAAIESGWGSSRFALQGNALFGQWAWKASAGLKPLEGSNSKAVVRSFPDLMSSVRAYMKNLNSHRAYSDLRDMRAEILSEGRQPTGIELAIHLDNYAEIGQAYVQKLQTIISSNRFYYLEQVVLSR
ncbi:MAG: glucosaminidase domain-containing protein [Candidatus Puniceispirillaceae bacterium]